MKSLRCMVGIHRKVNVHDRPLMETFPYFSGERTCQRCGSRWGYWGVTGVWGAYWEERRPPPIAT